MRETPAARPNVVLGVSGGIAAYKAVELLRLLTESGCAVRVVPTDGALHFVGAATFAALSGQPVTTSVWDDSDQVPHVRIGQTADLVVVAPATADLLARAATGRADDLLTATLLTARCPVVMAPAMHTEMWEHAATQANVATLRSRGVLVVDPAEGRLTGADSGKGRLPEAAALADLVWAVLARTAIDERRPLLDLAGTRVLISAGGTREHLDPVRFLGNRSSGRQGYAIARAAVARGADVTVVAANVALPDPAGAKVVRVTSAAELRVAMIEAAPGTDIVVMTAAVADFRPAAGPSPTKQKKTGEVPPPVELALNPDILVEIAAGRATGQVVVGFAAETDDVIANGLAKLERKGVDLLVVNEVGEGLAFETEDNEVVILGADGSRVDVPRGPKTTIAHAVLDAVAARLS